MVATLALAMATGVHAQPTPAGATQTVDSLLQAIRADDASRYAQIAPTLTVMVAPDFGVPVSFAQARKTFGPCKVSSLSSPKPLAGMPDHALVTAVLTCEAPLPQGDLTFDFLADAKEVYGIYPGGFERFDPGARKAQP